MQTARRSRASPKDTPARIIEAAERLFGRHGLDGVSLRQIGAAAGALNHFSVQYHFADRAGLIRAIFEHRLPALEARRAEMLAQATQQGRLGEARALTEILFRPIADEKDHQGRRSYAAFLASLQESEFSERNESYDLAPVSAQLTALLRGLLPPMPSALFAQRVQGATSLFLQAVASLERRLERGEPPPLSEEALLQDAIAAATAALAAPLPAQVHAEWDAERGA